MFEVLHQNYHLQGFTTDGTYFYWSFTDSLVKTTRNNTVIAQVHIPEGHLGDIDYYNGSLYATCMGNSLKGRPWGVWTSFFVNVYDAETLVLQRTIRLDSCYDMYANPVDYDGFNGVDGICVVPTSDGTPTLWVAAALFSEERYSRQMLMKFSLQGELLEKKYVQTGNTVFGIQNLDYEEDTGYFYFSTYAAGFSYQPKETLYCVDVKTETVIESFSYYSPYGFHALGNGTYLVSGQAGVNKNRRGYAVEVSKETLRAGLSVTEATTAYEANP